MSVKKSVLEQKSDKQLEEYIKPESRFVPQAIKFAYEILKARGRDFSEEETEIITSLITKKEEKEKEKKPLVIHENHIQSSNLMYVSAVLGLINFFLSGEAAIKTNFKGALFGILFVVFLGALIRRGYNGVKYVLVVSLLLGSIVSLPYLIYDLKNFPLNGIIDLCNYIAQIAATILLFLIPKENENTVKEMQDSVSDI
nr:hypothetical protein [Flavobacterium sp. ASV13]